MELTHNIITYILNLIIGVIQFKTAVLFVESKTSLPRLLISSFVLLTIYSVCVYFTSSWILVPLYIVLFAATMVLALKVELTPGILCAGLIDCISGVINILIVSSLRMINPQIISSKSSSQGSLSLIAAKLFALVLWIAVYLLLHGISRKIRMIFRKNENINYLIVNILFLVLFLYGNIILFTENSEILSLESIFINSSLVICFVGYSAYIFLKYLTLTRKQLNAENQLQQNRYLRAELDKLKAFKHGQANSYAIIAGLVKQENLPMLREYMGNISAEFGTVKSIEALDAYANDIPCLYGLLLMKIHDAEFKSVRIELSLHIPEGLTRKVREQDLADMVGIFLDNAIEATAACTDKSIDKQILVSISQRERLTITVRNPYMGEVDLDALSREGVSTKEGHSGYGLYQVETIIRRYDKKKINIITEYDTSDQFFTVKLRI